ncbi:ChaN family lipoprotein [Geomonas sp.]|uniref:ChaN family lipoprotein n=1 Tax=Geomonas sp. TaxID=2651584 RepID=UPI002B476994|nr:ChaN family lipoprotein [Geomonas sp.]HJV37118.1 ChaN family lipoprotein [Geomonas sp.]
MSRRVPWRACRGLVCAMLFLAAGGCTWSSFTRAADGTKVPFEQMVQEIQDARVILVGEQHDRMKDHRLQLQIIDALQARGRKLAIAAEMFTASSQDKLDLWTEGRMDALSFQWLYSDNWSEPWPLYRDIFLYAGEHRIPIVGLNYDRELMHRISREGIGALSKQEAAQLPPDLSCDRNSRYTQFLQAIYESHPGRVGSFENYCVAQTVWNKGMARHVVEYLKLHPERTVVAIVGSYHAVRDAIPAAAANLDCRILIPMVTPGIDTSSARDGDFLFR